MYVRFSVCQRPPPSFEKNISSKWQFFKSFKRNVNDKNIYFLWDSGMHLISSIAINAVEDL